jgi:hypothetical protein
MRPANARRAAKKVVKILLESWDGTLPELKVQVKLRGSKQHGKFVAGLWADGAPAAAAEAELKLRGMSYDAVYSVQCIVYSVWCT